MTSEQEQQEQEQQEQERQQQKTYHFKNSCAFMMASFHEDENEVWAWFSFLAEKKERLPVIYRKGDFPDLLKRGKWVLTNINDSLKLESSH